MNIAIKVDAKDAIRFLTDLEQRQVPYAISTAINDTLKLGQRFEREHIRAHFTLRRPEFIERTVKISQFASKRNPVGVIEIDPTRDVLAKFEAGGRKQARGGGALAVPIAVRRTKTDLIVKNMRIRELQLRAHRTNKGVVQLKGQRRTFTVKGRGVGAILQRVGRKPKGSSLSAEIAGGSLRVIYAFKRSVPIPANLEFTKSILLAVEEWPKLMDAAMAKAIATAK